MVLQCYSWILSLFRQQIGDDDDDDDDDHSVVHMDDNLANNLPDHHDMDYFANLPDVIIIDILSRLPPTTLSQCRYKVCRRWRMLTSSPRFVELYHTRARPETLLFFGSTYLQFLIVDEKIPPRYYLHRQPEDLGVRYASPLSLRLITSCNGLVLLHPCIEGSPSLEYYVFNPFSRVKSARATVRVRHRADIPCGLFFHPTANEYRILFALWVEGTNLYEYYMYLLGAKNWRRVADVHHAPEKSNDDRLHGSPAIANRCLYWSRRTNILVFDIISEKFFLKPLPCGTSWTNYVFHVENHLSVKEGDLCFCYVHVVDPVMDIWILEDHANWFWTKRYSVDLNWDADKYPVGGIQTGLGFCYCVTNVVSVHKHELRLYWKDRGLFSYNLYSHMVKRNQVVAEVEDNFTSTYYSHLWKLMSYTKGTATV